MNDRRHRHTDTDDNSPAAALDAFESMAGPPKPEQVTIADSTVTNNERALDGGYEGTVATGGVVDTQGVVEYQDGNDPIVRLTDAIVTSNDDRDERTGNDHVDKSDPKLLERFADTSERSLDDVGLSAAPPDQVFDVFAEGVSAVDAITFQDGDDAPPFEATETTTPDDDFTATDDLWD